VKSKWVVVQQQQAIEYLREENRILYSGPAFFGPHTSPTDSEV